MTIRRVIITACLICVGAGIVAAILNVRGWRARLYSRLTRVDNYPVVVEPPPGFLPHVPPGFQVSVFASGFQEPRWLAVAPNGDVFVADSAAGTIIVLHPSTHPNQTPSRQTFATDLNLPFGIAFHDQYVYAACTDEVIRFRYDRNTSQRLGEPEKILDLPGRGYHQHWTRSLAFSSDGKTLFISVGSATNVSIEKDPRRAAILAVDPDGRHPRIFASGLRNAVGIAVCPTSGILWAAVNERDDISDDVPADFFTHIVEGGFYGWPYSYLGKHVDNRVSSRPDLVARAIAPDLLLDAHAAPLQFAFYEGQQFPSTYLHGAFIAEHGSWNRRFRSGYQVIFIPFQDGRPSGPPIPFLSGMVPDPARREVYGRPVGIAIDHEGSLLVSDDGRKVIWQVRYIGSR